MKRRFCKRAFFATPEVIEVRILMTTLVAVIDSGVRFDDPNDPDKAKYFDFADAINEITGLKGEAAVYDDSNGGSDGHGSIVAKRAVQAIKDATAAIIGQQPDVKILPIKVYNSSLYYTSDAEYLKGITDAVDLGAKVINLSRADSFIFNSFPNTLVTAIQYAQSKGAVVITAPGNDGHNIDDPSQLDVKYPADLDDSAVIATNPQISNILVAAVVDANRNLYSTSNWGSVHVDFGAPTPGNSEGKTSYSAGYTSGVAGVVSALIQPQLPSGHNLYTDVINDIRGTVIPVTQSVSNWSTTKGVINPADAVARLVPGGIVDRTSDTPLTATSMAPYYAPQTAPFGVDGNLGSKWLDNASNTWLQYQFATSRVINQYTLTTGDDAPARDPKNWRFLASNDGTNWTTLDTRSNQSFAGRHQTVTYQFNNGVTYSFFRLQVDANNGDSLTQLSEFRLLGPYVTASQPSAPSGFSASTYSWKWTNLSWSSVTGATYTVERSTSITFATFTTLSSTSSTTLTDTTCAANTLYYYRVRAVVGGQTSAPSNVASLTTPRRVANDFDGDGKTDLMIQMPRTDGIHVVYRRSNGTGDVSEPVVIPSGDIPIQADYDGDGRIDFAYFDPSTSTFRYQPSSLGLSASYVQVQFGGTPASAIVGDFDGDGKDDIAVFMPRSNGAYFAYRPSHYGDTNHDVTVQLGGSNVTPVVADFDGDGKTDVAVFWNGSDQSYWQYIASSTGTTSSAIGFGPADAYPILGDFDGDGKNDLAVYSLRGGYVHFDYRKSSNTSQVVSLNYTYPSSNTFQPLSGDFNGDGYTDLAEFEQGPSKFYFLNSTPNTDLSADTWTLPANAVQFGSTDLACYALGTPPPKR